MVSTYGFPVTSNQLLFAIINHYESPLRTNNSHVPVTFPLTTTNLDNIWESTRTAAPPDPPLGCSGSLPSPRPCSAAPPPGAARAAGPGPLRDASPGAVRQGWQQK